MQTEIVIATSNLGKLREFSYFLSDYPISIIPQPQGLQIEETGTTFKANARIKALAVAEMTGIYSLADDSGLSVEALDNRPGVYSSRYGSNDSERISCLLHELNSVKNRKAFFTSALCIASPEKKILLEVESRC